MGAELSIIVPVYNAGSMLERLTASLQRQTFQDYEVLLIDDGSTDQSLALCQEIASKDRRFRVFHTVNQGAGPARNLGIEHAAGRWVYFPDADDELFSDTFLENLMERASALDVDLLVFSYLVKATNGRMAGCFTYPDLQLDAETIRLRYERHIAMDSELAIQGAPWNKLFRLSLIKDFSVKFPPLRRHQDEGFISRYMQYADSVAFLPLTGYVYYCNDSALVNRKYPLDYVESVKGLYRIRKETILKWNPQNEKVNGFVAKELFCNMIHAFELSFHSKFDFDRKERQAWMRKHLQEVDYEHLNTTMIRKRPYHWLVYRLLPLNFSLAYLLIGLKYHAESILR